MRPLTGPTGEPTKAVFVFTSAMLGLIDRAQPDMLVVTELFVRESRITAHPNDQYYTSAVPIDEAISYAKQLEPG